MCGIIGVYSIKNTFTEKELHLMTDAIKYRGPDAEGHFMDDTVGLGHRRLSIIDLSVTANQPMLSTCGRYVIVFNGEVYNFKEIAKELKVKKPSLHLKTTSDTEVILEAFVHWGEGFVNKLNGMYAFAIYDKETKVLFIARDRMGIKPLYYYWDGDSFLFTSELKALKELHSKIKLTLNISAINEFLHLGYIPEPHSIYLNIQKFPSGSYARVEAGKATFTKYWKPEDRIERNVTSDYSIAKDELKGLIESSVKYRMISDVPFGTFLSGGIDSSLVTAVAQNNSSVPVNTFSIGFKDATHNESSYAKSVADQLGTNHHELMIDEKEAIDLVQQLNSIYDEPYADSSAIPTLLVSKLARQYVKMTLSGDGGDELFMGYGAYRWAKRLSNPLFSGVRKPVAMAFSALGSRYKRIGQLLNYQEATTLKSHIFSQEQCLFSRIEIKTLMNTGFASDISLAEHEEPFNRRLTAAEKQALFDLNYYLKDDLLVKVDRATMHHSLETRVPLLDFRIVEFALNLSPSLKMNGSMSKYMLKEVLYDYLPEELFDRPKQGFSVPLAKWLRGELKFLIDDYLSETLIRKHGIVNYQAVQVIKEQFLVKNIDYLYNRIWLLIVLHKWLEENE